MPAAPTFPAAVEFGSRIKRRRQRLGLTQEGLAERCGLHWTYVGQIERGKRNITLKNILRLAHGLEINPATLVRDLKY
jgi:transcriptional regulator with XRE-family HTH domain